MNTTTILRVAGTALVAVLVGSVACTNTEWGVGGDGGVNNNNNAGCTDADNDNYCVEGTNGKPKDCDDSDGNIYPGATERENCQDDNCDGRRDEGTKNFDKDGDGYCPSTGDSGDCEGNAKRNPTMSEDGGTGDKKPNGIDDNCNGIVDEGLPGSDVDKDGFTLDDGDCNDRDAYVNPGAIEVAGIPCRNNDECPNKRCYDGYCRCVASSECSSGATCQKDEECKFAGETCKSGKCTSTFTCNKAQAGLAYPDLKVCRDNTDNDCDKTVDELPVTCDDPQKLSSATAAHYPKAMEICDTDLKCGIEKNCPGDMTCDNGVCSRVVAVSFDQHANQDARAIMAAFARNGSIKPKRGKALAVLSTGIADYDPNNNTTCPQDGKDFYLKNGKDPDPQAKDKDAYDMVALSMEVVVPTNARSLSFDFHFFTTEYPEYLDDIYNDTFWVQMEHAGDSAKGISPFTGNISFDKNGTPIRLNGAFFSICDPFPSKPKTNQMCTSPASTLTGTGYAKGECQRGYAGNFTVANGGSTGWLTTTAPVPPGKKVKLTFSIFDKGDGILDSAVVMDNFRWNLNPAAKPITGPD